MYYYVSMIKNHRLVLSLLYFNFRASTSARDECTFESNLRVAVVISGQPKTLLLHKSDARLPQFTWNGVRRYPETNNNLPSDEQRASLRKNTPVGLELMPPSAPWPRNILDGLGANATVAEALHLYFFAHLPRHDVFWFTAVPKWVSITDEEINSFCETLKPRVEQTDFICKVEPHENHEVRHEAWATVWTTFIDQSEARVRGTLDMLYGMYRANELRKEHERKIGIFYTHIVRLRPDILFWSPFPASEVFKYESDVVRIVARTTSCCGLENNFAAGPTSIMDTFLRGFEIIQEASAWDAWRSPNRIAWRDSGRPVGPGGNSRPDSWWHEDFAAALVREHGGRFLEVPEIKCALLRGNLTCTGEMTTFDDLSCATY